MTAIIVIVAAAAAVWSLAYLTRGSLAAGGLGFLVIGYCLGHDFLHFDLGGVPVTLDRLALVVLGAAYVVQRWMGRTDPKPVRRADVLLGAFLAVLAISTFAHDWRTAIKGQPSPVWLLVGGYLMPAVLYWIARQSRLNERNLAFAQGGLVALGVYLAATAVAEITRQWQLVYPTYISDPTVGIHFGRARGPKLQAWSLGSYLGVCWLTAIVWRERWGRAGRLAVWGLGGLFVAAIFSTYTRCSWLGAAAGLAVLACLTLRGAWRPMFLTGSLAAALVAGVFFQEQLVALDREGGSEATRDSTYQRASFTYVSWKMFLDRPMLGVGFGHFTFAKRDYLSDREVDLYLEALRPQPHHNTFLSLLTETGILGLALFVGLLGYWSRDAWRLWHSATAPAWARNTGLLFLAAGACWLPPAMAFDLTFSPQDNWLLFYLAGLSTGAAARHSVVAAASSAPARFESPGLAPKPQLRVS